MSLRLTLPRRRLSAEGSGVAGEGRGCELSRRLTMLVLFPHLDARPGPWLLALVSVCTFVVVRALELF